MDANPPAIIEHVTRAEHDALRLEVASLHEKLDHLIELSKLNAKALDWLVKAEKHEQAEADHG